MLVDQLEGVMTEEDEEFERIAAKQLQKQDQNMIKEIRNQTLEEVASELEKIKHDTAASYAAYIRGMKK